MEDDIAFYSRRNLARANAYVDSLLSGPIREFCVAPLTLAYATLDALGRGERKLNRNIVLSLTRRNSESHPDGSNAMEEVVLVNEKDEVVGTGEKIRTHQFGVLHRAFSTFIFNSEGQLLLQKRTSTKYHSRGLWSNTCCGHPRLNESTQDASRRRLREEMGFDCDVREVFQFVYRAKLEDGLTEHEYDHVFVGTFDGNPVPDGSEVDDWKWMSLAALNVDLQEKPEIYTCWFKIALDMLLRKLEGAGLDVVHTKLNA
jgi:isopentenyl-diphosphate delta-isomerase